MWCVEVGGGPPRDYHPDRQACSRRHLGAVDHNLCAFLSPNEPEGKPALGELDPGGQREEALGIDSVRECEGEL